MLRFVYTGDIQNRLLYDYFPGLSAAGAFGRDETGMAALAVLRRSDRSFLRILLFTVEGDVCHGY